MVAVPAAPVDKPSDWYSLNLQPFGHARLFVVRNPQSFARLHHKYDWPGDVVWKPSNGKAIMTSLCSPAGSLFYIIRVPDPALLTRGYREDGQVPTLGDVVGLIAHECEHVIDSLAEDVGEAKMGLETRGYMMGRILAFAVDSYALWYPHLKAGMA